MPLGGDRIYIKKKFAQQTVINPVTWESRACMTTEKRAAFLWIEKVGVRGTEILKVFPEEVASELDLEKGRGL